MSLGRPSIGFWMSCSAWGVRREVLLVEGHRHYEFAQSGNNHHHLVCSEYGRVVERHWEKLDEAVRRICDEHGFDLQEGKIEITIVCDHCRGEQRHDSGGDTSD